MVGVGGWCAPKARARKDGLPKEMACRGIGVSQKQWMRLQRKSQAAWARNFCCKKNQAAWTRNPCYEKNQVTWRCAAKGWRGATAKPPPRLRRGDSPATKNTTPLAGESCCINKSTALLERPAVRSRSCARQYEAGQKEQLGGASADAQSYWQGRFAACALVGDFLWSGRPRKSWGVAPNPTMEHRPLTPQGGIPRDPFWAARLERFSLTGSSSTL